jgi:hypothetical protein
MANGDDAAAAGFDLVPGTADLRMGWDEINKSRDYTSRNKTAIAGKAPLAHTHTSAQISDANENAVANTIIKRGPDSRFGMLSPTDPAHGATKGYVDAAVASGGSAQANGPTSTAYNRGSTGSGWYQVWMNSSLQFMRNTSSARFKKKIKPMTAQLRQVLQLRPVTFEYKDADTPGTHMGLIAEEVAELFPLAVTWEEDAAGVPQPYGINYDQLVVPAIKALQEQQATIDTQTAQIKYLLDNIGLLLAAHEEKPAD